MNIVIGGQVDKKEVESLVKEHADNVTTVIKSDVEAAMAVKSGQADIYIGACATGGGGALAMAIAILGKNQCETVSMPGRKPDEAKIKAAVEQGKKAFGFTSDHKKEAVSMIMKALQEKS